MRVLSSRWLSVGAVFAVAMLSCKSRNYNQSKTKDLLAPTEGMVTLCTVVAGLPDSSSSESKAGVRVACTGSCNGIDYRNRKFYILNDEKVAAHEFSVMLNSGREIRNLYVFEPTNGVVNAIKSATLENADVQKALQYYGLESNNISQVVVPKDSKLILLPGTKASLSTAGLLDGGSLDCGGQPIDGSVELNEFKTENLNDVKNATTKAN